MRDERKQGIACSAVLHLLLLLLLIFGLPSMFRKTLPPEPTAITVELLPISKISNVKPNDGVQTDKPKPPEPPKPEPEVKKPSPPVKTAEAPPPPPPPIPKPEPKKPEVKKPEPKPEPKKPEKPKPPKEEDLNAILKAVKETAQNEKTDDKKEPVKEKPTPSPKAISTIFDPNKQISISEKDAIMGQLAKCWNPPAGAKDAQNLKVVINAEFNTDGSYIRSEIADESRSRYNSDPFFRAAADAALRAVRMCSPLKNLPPEKYEYWRYMELHFDPKELLL